MKNLIALFLFLISSQLFAQCGGQAQSITAPQTFAILATNPPTPELALQMAQIKSKESLLEFMKVKSAEKNPLMLLTDEARARFLESLTFNSKGLTGYRYVDLENELTPTQIAKVLTLFGSQSNTSLFKKARIKTAKDRRILNDELSPALVDCGGDEEGGDYPIGGGVTTNPQGPSLPPPPPPPTAPRDYVGYQCFYGTCTPDRLFICKSTCNWNSEK
jgi:hypothetical protein